MQRVSKQLRNELVEALRERYKVAGKTERSRILKEFAACPVTTANMQSGFESPDANGSSRGDRARLRALFGPAVFQPNVQFAAAGRLYSPSG